jgi:hypothetical protein
MAKNLNTDEARRSLNAHLAAEGAAIRAKYGPHIGWDELLEVLRDPAFVRWPCEIRFDASPLLPGELAHPILKGATAEEGYAVCVHPSFADQLALVPYIVLYQLAQVNYGDFATPEDAETFGCQALGVSREAYYEALCGLAAQVGGAEPMVWRDA